MEDVFIARQAIFDRRLEVAGYELLFRNADTERADIQDGDAASTEVIVNAFMELGVENIVGSQPAFINLTRDFLTDVHPLPVAPEQVVLEVLEDIEPTPEVLDGLKRLREAGYRIALDDFDCEVGRNILLHHADLVKLDIDGLGEKRFAQQAAALRKWGMPVLAEKVETPAHFRICRELDLDYYQGYYFRRPNVVRGRRLPANRLVALELIQELQDENLEFGDLEHIIAKDVVLSYKLLRYINCASFALRREVDSIRQALVLLGVRAMRKWTALILMAGVAESKPIELFAIAMTRARMCELLAEKMGEADTDRFFTVGLFSVLDAIMDTPLDDLLDQVSLSVPVKLALLDGEGTLGAVLNDVIRYERGAWDELLQEGIDVDDYRNAYLEALQWADSGAQALRVSEDATLEAGSGAPAGG